MVSVWYGVYVTVYGLVCMVITMWMYLAPLNCTVKHGKKNNMFYIMWLLPEFFWKIKKKKKLSYLCVSVSSKVV